MGVVLLILIVLVAIVAAQGFMRPVDGRDAIWLDEDEFDA